MRRISFYQIPISPRHVVDGLNREQSGDGFDPVDGTRVLDVPDSAVIYPLGWEHQGSANPEAGTGMLNLLVVETVVSDD